MMHFVHFVKAFVMVCSLCNCCVCVPIVNQEIFLCVSCFLFLMAPTVSSHVLKSIGVDDRSEWQTQKEEMDGRSHGRACCRGPLMALSFLLGDTLGANFAPTSSWRALDT